MYPIPRIGDGPAGAVVPVGHCHTPCRRCRQLVLTRVKDRAANRPGSSICGDRKAMCDPVERLFKERRSCARSNRGLRGVACAPFALTRKMHMHDNEHVQFSPSEQDRRGSGCHNLPGKPDSPGRRIGASRRVVLSALIRRLVQLQARSCTRAQHEREQGGFVGWKRQKQQTRGSL